jgi:uncharacterized membrane protein
MGLAFATNHSDIAGNRSRLAEAGLFLENPMSDVIPTNTNAPQEPAVQITHVTYALYALGLLTAGVIAIAGLIIAYVKRDDMKGTYLESHMTWLIGTFWWSVLWAALTWAFILLTLGIGLIVAWIFFGIIWIWFAYKIIKGWLRLSEKRAV